VVLPLQIALADLLERLWTRGAGGRAVLAALLALGAASTLLRIDWLLRREKPDLSFVEKLTPAEAVILSDPLTSNGVAGLTGRKVVMPLHPDLFLLMADGPERMAGVQDFFSASTASARRLEVLRRWHVTHVLIDRLRQEPPADLPCLTTHNERGYLLCAVERAALKSRLSADRDIGDNTPAADARRGRGRRERD
jgi:hypothetical protein